MRIFGFDLSRKDADLDAILARLTAIQETAAGIAVTPDNCEESPTVQAIVNGISMSMSTLPVHVYRKTVVRGREQTEKLPTHPVEQLLATPNAWQSPSEYWLDAASCMVRHGKFFAVKSKARVGPVRALLPVHPDYCELKQTDDLNVYATITTASGRQIDYPIGDVHRVRGRSRDFLTGDSPVRLAKDAIALEIAAQRFGGTFFSNGAMPGLIFEYREGFRGHLDKKQRDEFVESFQQAYGRKNRLKALMLPQGIAKPTTVAVENDKAQFLETRKLQRNIIAGCFGVPPHLVGDLERATFTNIEHQSQEFVAKVLMPYISVFEDAMERDLLTPSERTEGGIVIRFNVDAQLRADFKTRQEGLKIQREAGVISPNDWRQIERMNPREGGDTYWEQGPSGQTGSTADDDADQDPEP